MALILIEGVDGAGKSALCDAVSCALQDTFPRDDIEQLHSGPLDEPPLDAYVHSISDYTPGAGRHIVADRWHYGEQVYGPIYRGKSAFTEPAWRWTELWLASRGAQVTVVTNTLAEIQRRLEERGEDFLQPEHVDRVISGFNRFTHSPTYAQTVEVGGECGIEELAVDVVRRAVAAEASAADINDVSNTYVGSLCPRVILVGEKRGGEAPYVTESAFMPVGGNSADFLWRHLPERLWPSVGAINAKEEFDLAAVFERFVGVPVVALGGEASRVLQRAEISHGKVAHPQWVRRFKNKHGETYARLIQDAIETQEDLSKWPN